MNARDAYTMARRHYRVLARQSAVTIVYGPARDRNGHAAVGAYAQAVRDLRAITGRWDTCDAVRHTTDRREHVSHGRRMLRWTPHVAAACTRWMRGIGSAP